MCQTLFSHNGSALLKGAYYANVQVHICMLCFYCDMSPCFNVQKGLYFSHTASAAAPLFTLCLKPEPSLIGTLCLLAYHVQCVRVLANRCGCYIVMSECVGEKLPLAETLRS